MVTDKARCADKKSLEWKSLGWKKELMRHGSMGLKYHHWGKVESRQGEW